MDDQDLKESVLFKMVKNIKNLLHFPCFACAALQLQTFIWEKNIQMYFDTEDKPPKMQMLVK